MWDTAIRETSVFGKDFSVPFFLDLFPRPERFFAPEEEEENEDEEYQRHAAIKIHEREQKTAQGQ